MLTRVLSILNSKNANLVHDMKSTKNLKCSWLDCPYCKEVNFTSVFAMMRAFKCLLLGFILHCLGHSTWLGYVVNAGCFSR